MSEDQEGENMGYYSYRRMTDTWETSVDGFAKKKLAWLPARIALGAMAFFGFLNLYMVRMNLSVAIVAMVKRNTSTNNFQAACESRYRLADNSSSVLSFNTSQALGPNYAVDKSDGLDNDTTASALEDHEDGEMYWDATTQGLILSSFFYGYILTQIIGGRIAELQGTRLVFGICILAGGISALLTPVVARYHYVAFIAMRIIQGMFQGVSFPSMHACISRWIPPVERPQFIAVVYLATNLSSAITLPLCGVIIDTHGWPAAFYVTGTLSVVCACVWLAFMYNSPSEHPRITAEELNYIETAIRESGTSAKGTVSRVPWKEIFMSLPVWAIVVAAMGNSWGISLFYAQLPTYMKNVLGFSIKANGALSALPFLSRYFGGIIWSSLGSWLIARKFLSIVNTRRVFSVLSLWGPGAMIVIVTFVGCDWKATVALFCMALFCNGAATSSIFVSHTDIAPNFSGTLLGITNTSGSIISCIVPVVTGVMIDGQQTLEAWQRVFWICAPMYIISEIIYLALISGDVQPWNNLEEDAPISKSKKAVSD